MQLKIVVAGLHIAMTSTPSLAASLGITQDGSFFTVDGRPAYMNGIRFEDRAIDKAVIGVLGKEIRRI
jgi:hypothetical protein